MFLLIHSSIAKKQILSNTWNIKFNLSLVKVIKKLWFSIWKIERIR